MKGKGKRVLSGLLSLLTILTSVIQPVVTYAAEPEPPAYEAQYRGRQDEPEEHDGQSEDHEEYVSGADREAHLRAVVGAEVLRDGYGDSKRDADRERD